MQDFKPTQSMVEVKNELNALIDAELNQWQKVKTQMLPEMNKLIKDKALDIIVLPKQTRM
jgi:hypothetical protein